jgi:cell division protein FtsQ
MRSRSVTRKQSVRKKKRKRRRSLFGKVQRFSSAVVILCVAAAAVGGISVSFLWVYHYLLTSPYLKLEQVEMRGLPAQVQSDVVRLGGLTTGMSLLAIRLDEVKEKMEEHPWVRSVRLERRFPNQLVIEAEQQVPTALMITDAMYYLNQWGEIFKRVGHSEGVDLPILTGISPQPDRAQEQLHRAAHVLRVLESEEGLWSLDELSEIHMREDGAMSLYFEHLAAEIRLMWYDMENRLAGLKRLTQHLSQTGKLHHVSRIDLNQTDGAVVSFRQEDKKPVQG